MTRSRLALALALILPLAACARTAFHGLRPVYPDQDRLFPPTVDSLQPTLRWEQSTIPGATYDLVVYEVTALKNSWGGIVGLAPGEMVYYREGMPNAEHRLETPLKPHESYFWSVRARVGDKASDWSRYDRVINYGSAIDQEKNQLFVFNTPNQ